MGHHRLVVGDAVDQDIQSTVLAIDPREMEDPSRAELFDAFQRINAFAVVRSNVTSRCFATMNLMPNHVHLIAVPQSPHGLTRAIGSEWWRPMVTGLVVASGSPGGPE